MKNYCIKSLFIVKKNYQGDENMKNGLWENKEVKDLFDSIERIKREGQPLRKAFMEHARKYSRQPNSVRNYYYHEIDNLEEDKVRLKNLGIDLDKHKKNSIQYFSKEEEEKLMLKIDKLVNEGYSVRKACLTLSNGDVNQMLRFQNKYRNFKSKQKPIKTDNIIKFSKKKDKISDAELQALFMGLVRLVKRSATDEVNEQVKNTMERANQELRKTIVALNSKEKEYKELKDAFIKIKEENSKLVKDIFKLKCDKAGKLREKFNKSKMSEN